VRKGENEQNEKIFHLKIHKIIFKSENIFNFFKERILYALGKLDFLDIVWLNPYLSIFILVPRN